MSAGDPPAKRLCLTKTSNVAKPVSLPLPQDIINVIKAFIDKNDEVTYRSSLERFRRGDIDRQIAFQWLKQLEDSVIVLDNLSNNERKNFVNVLVTSTWIWLCNIAIVEQYKSLLECLLSSNASYATTIVESLVPLFMSKTKEENVEYLGKLNDDETRLFNNVHKFLEQIVVKLVPITAEVLVKILEKKFPNEFCNRNLQACYVANLLKVIDYLPNFRMQILEKVVSRLKVLDLECPWDKIQEEEQTSICESIPETSEGVQSLGIIYKMNHKQANLLDVLMKLMFEFIHKTCHKSGSLDWKETRKLFKELLTIFDKEMVGVGVTNHVQFVMFYITSYHLKMCRGFFDYFWKKVINVNLPSATRTWAACYIGSFIVRQATIPISTVKDCLRLLKDWVGNYLDKFTAGQAEYRDDHAPFYAVCQAIFYILTFRIEELMQMKNGRHFISTLYLTSIISSKLRPLKFCSANMVQQFVIKVKDFAYCNPYMLEDGDVQRLNFFLPFDPYILARSSEFIEPIYRIHIEQDFYGHQDMEKDLPSEDEALEDWDDSSTRDSLQSFILD